MRRIVSYFGSLIGIAPNEKRAQPVATANGRKRPWLISNVGPKVMSLPEKAFNSVVSAMKAISQIEPTTQGVQKEERARRRELDDTLAYPSLKVISRPDAKERVRIVQKGQDYGAVVDFDDPTCGWSPGLIVAGGFIYESAAVAEAQARATLSWMKDPSQEPNQSLQPTGASARG
jgi:hypothetical protein